MLVERSKQCDCCSTLNPQAWGLSLCLLEVDLSQLPAASDATTALSLMLHGQLSGDFWRWEPTPQDCRHSWWFIIPADGIIALALVIGHILSHILFVFIITANYMGQALSSGKHINFV